MERLVDYDKFIKDYGVLSNYEDDYRLLCAANITAYTKDEVIAMFAELKAEVEEQLPMIDICDYSIDSCVSRHEVANIIQQKINALISND